MLKIFELYVRKSGLDAADYLKRLSEAAGNFAAADAIRGFTIQQSLPLPARKDIVQLNVPTEVDAFAEFWVDSIDAYEQALESGLGLVWRGERATLVQCAKTLVVQENPLIPVPLKRPPTRNNAFLTRHRNFTPEQFRHEWIVGHGNMCKTVPHLEAFVPCVVMAELRQRDIAELGTDLIEGIAQAYFASPEAEIAMIQTPEAKLWFAHGAETFGLIKAFGAKEFAARIPAAGAR